MSQYDAAIAVLESEINGVDGRISDIYNQLDSRKNTVLPKGAIWDSNSNDLYEQKDRLEIEKTNYQEAIDVLRLA